MVSIRFPIFNINEIYNGRRISRVHMWKFEKYICGVISESKSIELTGNKTILFSYGLIIMESVGYYVIAVKQGSD